MHIIITVFSVCHAYKLCLFEAEPAITALAKRSHKYEWAAEKYLTIMKDREKAVNIIFQKLTEFETDGYYAKLFQSKIDDELSKLIDTL